MAEKKRKFYITTSIAYTNASPHIGFALELVQADVLARYHKILGDDVFFLTGTDEHGIKIAKSAKEANKEPQRFVDELTERFVKLTKDLNISNNDFIRTTDKKRHWPVVKKLWQKLKEKNDLYKKNFEGWYCEGCEAFLSLKKDDEIICATHLNKKPILIKEENWFFRLSNPKYVDKIKKLINKDEIRIIPESKKNEILEIIDQEWPEFENGKMIRRKGLTDISFSRSSEKLNWGFPVPDDNSQKIYVWADALTNYISALGYPNNKKFKKYWPADIHCIGKDILKFHALIWPAMLLSAELDLPKSIFVHGFITVNNQKMSKSLGNVIDPFSLVDKYGTDAVRYFLLREIPSTEDGDFTYEKFEQRYNSDLAGGIGNLVARVLGISCVEARPPLKLALSLKGSRVSKNFKLKIKETQEKYKSAIENFKFNEALATIWALISYCDKYINDEKLWETKKPEAISDLFYALNEISGLLSPFLPETAEKILRLCSGQVRKAVELKKSEILFPKIN